MLVNTFAKELKKRGFASRRGQQSNGWTGIDLKPGYQNSGTGDDLIGFPSKEARQKLAFSRS
jgi:hypothetical protein